MRLVIPITAIFLFPLCLRAQPERLQTFDLEDKRTLLMRLFDSKLFDDTNGEVLWKPVNFADEVSANFSDDGYQHTALDTVMYFNTYGAKRAVAVFSTLHYEKGVVSDCHACGALISAAIFHEAVSGKWQIERFGKHFTSVGSDGDYGAVGLTQFGENQWCLSLGMEWIGQGIFGEYISFWGLEELNRVFNYTVHEDNSGSAGDDASRAYAFDKTIHFITDSETPNNSGWWDFELVTRGTKLDEKEVKIITANQVQHFAFDWDTDHYIKICK